MSLRATLLLAVLTLFSFALPSHAQIKIVGYWHLGDDAEVAKVGEVLKKGIDRSPGGLNLDTIGEPAYSDEVPPKAPTSKLSVSFDGKATGLTRKGLPGNLNDNFVAEAFVRATTDEGFRVILQYGAGTHGWSLIRNKKGYQVMLGGVALVGWSGDIASGEWVHLAVVRDNGITRFFVNGKLSGDSKAKLNDADGNATFSIGTDADRKQFFGGNVDEVRVSTFLAGAFDPAVLLINDPDGKAADSKKEDAKIPSGHTSIIFDETPLMKGMSFKQQAMSPRSIDTPGGAQTAWVAQQGSAPDVPWARSVLITITDPSLRDGNQPVVDIEVEYRQTFDSPVELVADTESGSRKVGGGWGRNDQFQRFVVSLDDAFFGSRDHGNPPKELKSDGYDFRINSFGTDFAIRSIKLKTYDLRDNPDFKRLIRFRGVSTPNDLMIFAPGSQQTITYAFHNLAFKQAKLKFRHEVIDSDEKVVVGLDGPLDVPGRSDASVVIPIDTAGLLKGVYRTRLRVANDADATIFERGGGFAVAENSPVERAKPGEFLYGLDIQLGAAYDSPRLLKWAQFMGADIIRHGFGGQDDVNEIAAHLPTFEQYGLQVMYISDPPKDQALREEQLPGKLTKLVEIATRFPQIKFYELGNEPDLTYFYPGPMKNYVADFQKMSEAITTANPGALVLNGGLCFAGNEAADRAREFIQTVDPKYIGIWAYHGHGPGAKAEADALVRIRDLVRGADKLKPFADTETGVAAQTPQQERVQARTVVQKMVYAQSQELKFLMFFRLLMFEEAYGMLYSETEPRPSVLAYANLVRTLRGTRYEETLGGLPSGVEGYAFKSDAGSRRTLVLWNTSHGTQSVYLSLGRGGIDVRQSDLFGNTAPVSVGDDGSIEQRVGADPVFVTWSSEPAPKMAVVPLAILVPDQIVVRESGEDTIPVDIVSHGEVIHGTLHVIAGAQAGATISADPIPVDVAAKQSARIDVSATLGDIDPGIRWPSQWTAFVDVAPSVDVPQLKFIPVTLPTADGGTATGRSAVTINYRIDFEQLGGHVREKAVAVVMAHVESDVDRRVRVGASADWWMQWVVNGTVAYSTLDRGNGGGYSVTDHTFTIDLKKGDNLIAVKQLSGSMGWKLLIGSPQRLNTMAADLNETGLRFELRQPGKVTQVVRANLQRRPTLTTWKLDRDATTLADWDQVQPDLLLVDNVTNHFAAMPDASKWWKGPRDLSARGWLRIKDDKLFVMLAVADDELKFSGDDPRIGDAVRIELLNAQGEPATIYIKPIADGTAKVISPDAIAATATTSRSDASTFYQIEISQPPATRARSLKVTVFDQDDVPAKQDVSLASPYRLLWKN